MFDVAKMTDEELRAASSEISAEMMKRERVEEEKLWNNFVDAFRAYCEKFEYIEINDNRDIIYLTPNDYDLSSIGEINYKY